MYHDVHTTEARIYDVSIFSKGHSFFVATFHCNQSSMTDSTKYTNVATAAALGIGIGFVAARWWNPPKINRLASRSAYKRGQKPNLPSKEFGQKVHIFDPANLKSAYNLVISSVTPRPIALVSSRNPDTGVDNVAPFSYFGAVSHDPPMFAIGFCRKNGVKKDSLSNILASREFAVNIISSWYLDAANHSCGNFQPEVDEFIESGMTKGDCQRINVPRVKEAAVTYECTLDHVYEVQKMDTGNPTTEIILAKVVCIHVDNEVLAEGSDPLKPVLDTLKLDPIGRLGGNIYTTIGETVEIARPPVS